MANSVHLADNDIVEVKVIGNQTYASVMAMGRQVQLLLEQQGAKDKPKLILDDITRLGATDIPARKAVSSLAHSLAYHKVAMVGDGSVLMRVGTNLLLRAIGKGGKIKYFEDRTKAMQWLLK